MSSSSWWAVSISIHDQVGWWYVKGSCAYECLGGGMVCWGNELWERMHVSISVRGTEKPCDVEWVSHVAWWRLFRAAVRAVKKPQTSGAKEKKLNPQCSMGGDEHSQKAHETSMKAAIPRWPFKKKHCCINVAWLKKNTQRCIIMTIKQLRFKYTKGLS